MPRQGFTTITITKDVYEKIKKAMNLENEKAGYRKFRSISHFVESMIMEKELE